ncbi:MAG: hypothetical protein ACYTGH_07825 [Planctomycetota bacterium]
MATHRPNVVIISTHDNGRHFGCYGVTTVQTPNIQHGTWNAQVPSKP